MKKISMLLMILAPIVGFGQQPEKQIQELWNTIHQKEAEHEVKSLIPTINEVKELSKQFKDYPSLLKAMFYEAKINIVTQEDSEYNINQVIDQFKAESLAVSGISKAVTEVYIAKLYHLYYQENSYQVGRRTEVENPQSNDIRFWSAAEFTKEINKHYQTGLSLAKDNKSAEVGQWNDLFISENTLDIDFSKFSVYDALRLDYAGYLADYDWRLGELEREEAKKKSEELLEEVLKELQSKKDTKHFLYTKMYQLSVKTNADEVKEQYQQLLQKYPKEDILYLGYANYLNGKALVDLANQVNKLFPGSETAKKLENLKKDTEKPQLSFRLKEYIMGDQSNPLLISYSNLNRVYVQVLKNTDGSQNRNNQQAYNLSDYKKLIAKYPVADQYEIALNPFEDYASHNTVAELKPLANGRYVVIMSSHPFKELEENNVALSIANLNVTPYLIVNGNKKARVYHRDSGKPLSDVSVVLANGAVRNNSKAYWETILKTDERGEINLDFLKENTRLYLNVKEDEVYEVFPYYTWRNAEQTTEEETTVYNASIFTDRAIYRPGQVVYFKSIVSRTKGKAEKLAVTEEFTVELSDVNGEKVSSLQLKTNEYGSVNGEFVLPSGGRLGNFEITINRKEEQIGYASISVEEYKRPKFEVKLEKPKAIYRFNEDVKVNGNALAFSGANLDNAVVKYRVTRREVWPYWIWKNRYPTYNHVEEPIANGEVKTNPEGHFDFNFNAVAKSAFDKEKPRTYIYTVYVDVTDINGETHSSRSEIVVGDKVIELTHKLYGTVDAEQLSDIEIKTQTLNHVDYGVKGEFVLYELAPPYPVRLLDKSFNEKTDSQLFSYDEFVKLFPYTPYDNEWDMSNWKEGKEVFKTDFDTSKNTVLHFKNANQLKSGAYIVKASIWENGEKTEFENRFMIQNSNKTENPNQLVELSADKKTYKAGDTAKIKLQSAEDDTYAVVTIMANDKTVIKKIQQIGKQASFVEIPIKKEYEGEVAVQVAVVKHNMALFKEEAIVLPENNNNTLKIEVESFRDKVQPGEQEKWTLKISGEGKDKVLAEVLANMYDASLDQFTPHNYHSSLGEGKRRYYANEPEFGYSSFSSTEKKTYSYIVSNIPFVGVRSSFSNPVNLNMYNLSFGGNRYTLMKQSVRGVAADRVVEEVANSAQIESADGRQDINPPSPPSAFNESDELSQTGYGAKEDEAKADLGQVAVRKNLQETAFFYPVLRTDEEGSVKVEFTMPEALTQWKFMAFAHTKDLSFGKTEKLIRTQKELMAVPNAPRFLRQGDVLALSSKIVNLSENDLSGNISLQLFDAFTMEPIDDLFQNTAEPKSFEMTKGSSANISWTVQVPKNIDAVVYRVVAKAGDYSDGEEAVLPVLSNRMLVTETMPISVKEGQNKLFKFDKYETQNESTLENFKLTLEMTTNPVWNAIFALPYVMEYPYDCSEQIFSKVFANAMATQLLNSNPRIKRVFDDWNRKEQLKSKLEQNEELKQILIEETPWVREAESQEEQMKRLAVLFDLNTMRMQLKTAFSKLEEQQNNDGGFPWFAGDSSNLYITQTIVEGFGNLKKMGVLDADWFDDLGIDFGNMIKNAVNYMDQQQNAVYQRQIKDNKISADNLAIHYLYVRSFFLEDLKISEKYTSMISAYRKGLEDTDPTGSLYTTAMKAVTAQRFGLSKTANSLVRSMMENAVSSENMGTYWKENSAGWLWYQAPVETQVMIMEAAHETDREKYADAIEDMKVWLLKNKQTTAWTSTKATTRAVYALLNIGKSWMDSEKGIEVKVGGYPIDLNQEAQMGSGYFKQSWTKEELKPKMGIVEVTKESPGVSYGAMYWQYFEDLDKITSAKSEIQFNKKLYLKANTDQGQKLREITALTPIKVGDRITVRLEITANQDMDYVHIKDMRASGFEPVNVFSGYRWKGEFGYYEETRDAATNFFIAKLSKGTYVFEYDLIANNAGTFSNGITTMQNMYAPEMSAHSEGIKVEIKP
jgi:uncharacterized protein YfaS (alpha-2-macroglobulin family)